MSAGRCPAIEPYSYFLSQNVGKECIALNLKTAEGQAALHRIIRELDADVFTCNTIPSRYAPLGIDYETLSAVKPGLIWAGISAMGPDYPTVAGYDPVIQAMCGYMAVTGFDDGPPTLTGIPVTDLKAGDEVYANVLLALAEGADRANGKRIDVSMFQAAASWLITLLPLIDLDCDPEEITRWGNAHRKFIPTNVYPTSDGYIYVAVGSNAQWRRLTGIERFVPVGKDGARNTPDARYADREAIYREIGEITRWRRSPPCPKSFPRRRSPIRRSTTFRASTRCRRCARRWSGPCCRPARPCACSRGPWTCRTGRTSSTRPEATGKTRAPCWGKPVTPGARSTA